MSEQTPKVDHEQELGDDILAMQRESAERAKERFINQNKDQKTFAKEHPIITGTALVAGGALTLTGATALAVNAFTEPTPSQQQLQERSDTLNAEREAFQQKIDDFLNAPTHQSDVVGEITVKQNTSLYDESLAIATGQPNYNTDNINVIKDLLLRTSKAMGITHPDDKFVVVSVDINDDGELEYGVKQAGSILIEPGQPLPAPIQQDQQLPTL